MGWAIARFCQGYISAFTNAGCYQIPKSRCWGFGFWLGHRLENHRSKG